MIEASAVSIPEILGIRRSSRLEQPTDGTKLTPDLDHFLVLESKKNRLCS